MQNIKICNVEGNKNIIFLREVTDPYGPYLFLCKMEVVTYESVSYSKNWTLIWILKIGV